MAVKNADLIDLIATTNNDLPKQEFEIMWDNPDYEFCRIYQKERMVIDGGTEIERKVMLDPTGNARYRETFDTDEPNVGDVMHTIKVGWCQIGTNYSWDKFEILQQKNSAKGFIDLMKVRRDDGLWSLAKLIEERGWKTPESSTDKKHPYGVPYYLSYYIDTSGTLNSSAGFLGRAAKFQDETYTADIAGISATDEAKWRNYCAVYTAVDNALLKTLRLAFMKTQFKAPLFVNDPASKRNAAKRIYTDSDTVAQLMDLCDKKDDNHTGKDVLSNLQVNDGGLVIINRLPVVWIPELESVSYTPIYCIDFSKFIPYVHDGYWMEEGEPVSGGTAQHTVFTVFLDGAHNNLCLNRRTCGFVLHKAS